MRGSMKTLAVAVAFGLAAVTTGCSVGIVDGNGEPEGAHDTPAPDDDGALSRQQVIAGASKVIRCDGEQTMLDDAVMIYVEGPCDRLILNTRDSQVATDDVSYLEVIGDGNLVLSGKVEKLLVNGRGNVVHWNGPTPKVQDVGSENVLTAG